MSLVGYHGANAFQKVDLYLIRNNVLVIRIEAKLLLQLLDILSYKHVN